MAKHEIELTILGCGNSTGVPAAGNYWGTCDPKTPKNRRTRPSVWVKSETTSLVIDTGPDFSYQATRAGIKAINSVLYTHAHGDHANGIDDLRRYMRACENGVMNLYTNHQTVSELQRRFYYLFEDSEESIYKKSATLHALDDLYGQDFRIGDLSFIPFEQSHGRFVRSVGFRFGSLAYCTDMKALDTLALSTLKGIKTWIVDAAAYNEDTNPVHASLKDIYAYNDIIGAQQVYLTSLSLLMDYQTLLNELPEGYYPAYDGLKFKL